MTKMFDLISMPSPHWRRITEQGEENARGNDTDARQHLVPTTDEAKKFIAWEAYEVECMCTGLCIGEVQLDNDEWVLAYRFVKFSTEEPTLTKFLNWLNATVTEVVTGNSSIWSSSFADWTEKEVCQRCGKKSPDLRTLQMSCFYRMEEMSVPFSECAISGVYCEPIGYEHTPVGPRTAFAPVEGAEERKHKFYTLRVCKRCRAEWMMAIQAWFDTPGTPDESDDDNSGLVRQAMDKRSARVHNLEKFAQHVAAEALTVEKAMSIWKETHPAGREEFQ